MADWCRAIVSHSLIASRVLWEQPCAFESIGRSLAIVKDHGSNPCRLTTSMILYDRKYNDKLHLELVDGDDICDSYSSRTARRLFVDFNKQQKQLRVLGKIPDCRQVRLLRVAPFISTIVLRAFVWRASTLTGQTNLILDSIRCASQYSKGQLEYIGLEDDFIRTWREECSSSVIVDDGAVDIKDSYIPLTESVVDELYSMCRANTHSVAKIFKAVAGDKLIRGIHPSLTSPELIDENRLAFEL